MVDINIIIIFLTFAIFLFIANIFENGKILSRVKMYIIYLKVICAENSGFPPKKFPFFMDSFSISSLRLWISHGFSEKYICVCVYVCKERNRRKERETKKRMKEIEGEMDLWWYISSHVCGGWNIPKYSAEVLETQKCRWSALVWIQQIQALRQGKHQCPAHERHRRCFLFLLFRCQWSKWGRSFCVI